jgi:hypothetical protein
VKVPSTYGTGTYLILEIAKIWDTFELTLEIARIEDNFHLILEIARIENIFHLILEISRIADSKVRPLSTCSKQSRLMVGFGLIPT